MNIRIAIPCDGDVQLIYKDDVADAIKAIGKATTVRASHVEPTPDNKWQADMSPVGGPKLPATDTRQESLDLEVAWLNKRLGKL